MPSFLKHPLVLVALGVIVGAAYGKQIPGLSTITSKLPGAS